MLSIKSTTGKVRHSVKTQADLSNRLPHGVSLYMKLTIPHRKGGALGLALPALISGDRNFFQTCSRDSYIKLPSECQNEITPLSPAGSGNSHFSAADAPLQVVFCRSSVLRAT